MTGEVPPRKARRWFRFSLRTLLLASLLAGSAMSLHSQWAPWVEETLAPAEGAGASYAEFSSDGTRILTLQGYRLIRLWDAEKCAELVRLDLRCIGARLSPDGRWAVLSHEETPWVSIWDANTGKEQARLQTALRFEGGAFAPDGSWLLTGSGEVADMNTKTCGAHLWDLRTGERVLTVAENEHVDDVRFSPCGRWFLTLTYPILAPVPKPFRVEKPASALAVVIEGASRIWNAETGREVAILRLHTSTWPLSAAFFPDGSRLAAIDRPELRVFDASSGRLLIHAIASDHDDVFVSPDGRRLLTAGAVQVRSNPQLWDATNLKVVGEIKERSPDLLGIRFPSLTEPWAFSPDNRRIVRDGRSSVWSAEDGTELWRLGRPLFGVNERSFDPEGLRIVSGDENGAIHVWTRRRPERWWGVVCLPAFWVTVLVLGAFAWSIQRDRKTLY